MMMRFVLALTVGVLLGGVVCGQTAGQLLMQRKKVSGSGFENLFVTPENGKALGWSGGTLGMLDVVAAGSAPSFSEVTITGGGIRSQSGSLAYKFYDVVDSVAVPYIQVRLYDDQDPPVLIGSSLMGFRADGGGGGKQIFQGSSDWFQFEGVGGADTASVFAANFIGGGAGLVNVPLSALTGLGSGVGTWLGTPSSANLRAAISDEVGTGAAYFVGGALGTPASVTLTNGTGLPIATGVSGLGSGVGTWLGTPSSANLRAAISDEVGTGAAYFVGGALGTPASVTLTNGTGLPLASGVTGVLGEANGGTGRSTGLVVRGFKREIYTGTASGTTICSVINSTTLRPMTEGDQYMNITYTPTNSASRLRVTVRFMGGASATVWGGLLLARAGDTNARAQSMADGGSILNSTSVVQAYTVVLDEVAGTTSPITYNVRFGGHLAGTFFLNRASASVSPAGTTSFIEVMEYAP